MNLSLHKTPAEDQAETISSKVGLDQIGLINPRQVYWNLPVEALYEEIIFRKEA